MELRIKRTQGVTGMFNKKVEFVLSARLFLDAEEKANIERYYLGEIPIYNSETSRKYLEKGQAATGAIGAFAAIAMHRMALNITVNSLTNGQVIVCSNLDEAVGAEEALKEACENIKGYIQVATMFDGSEETFEI